MSGFNVPIVVKTKNNVHLQLLQVLPNSEPRLASLFQDMSDVCVGTSVGTITEPECLGPCEPGTSVTLEGIVWHETEGGEHLLQTVIVRPLPTTLGGIELTNRSNDAIENRLVIKFTLIMIVDTCIEGGFFDQLS